MILINNLGEFDSLAKVWEAYPYGGKEGDFVVVNGVEVSWNKYTNSWGDDRDISAGNQPDVIPPVADPLPPASLEIDTLYNNLGEFNSLDEVWKAYPYGGKEGDFVVINNNEIAWNKYTKNWGDDTNNVSHPDISEEIDGDLLVKGDLHILGGVIATKLFESIPIDGVTIKWVSGKLQSEGLSLKEVEEFILGKKYITMDALAPYVTLTRLSNTLDDYAKIISLNEYATKEWVLSLSLGGSGEIDTSEFVTLSATQTITGLKDFIYGLNVGGINISKSQDGVIFIDGNLIVRGGITQYGVDEVTSPTIMDAIIVDGVTISKEGGYLHFVGELGQAGINEEELASYLERNGYIDRDALSSEGFAKADAISTILQDYISKEVFNSSIASLTKDFVDKKSQQDIEGIKNFINGFTIGDGIKIYKTQDGVIYLDGNLVLKGSLTQYGNESTPAPSIFDALPIDGVTIKWLNGKLTAVGGGGDVNIEGITLEDVEAYLAENNYITQDALAPYATSNSVSALLGNYLPLSSFTKSAIKSTLGISDWALTSAKPTYTAVEVGALGVNDTAQSALKMTPEWLTDLNSATPWRFFDMNSGYGSTDGNKPDPSWVSGMTGRVAGSSIYRWQLAMTSEISHPYFRKETNGIWSNWSLLAFTTDIPTKLSQLTDDIVYGKYLPIDGTAVAATKLATPRTIWGQSFDGMGDVDGDLTLNGGILSYTNGVWTLNGDLLVTGGVTQFAQGVKTASSIMDAIVVDGTTITKQDGKLVAIGGGGSASSIDWSGITNKPTTLAGYGIADAYTKNEVSEAITIEVVEKTRDFYTRSEAREIFALKASLDDKQNTLFSGVNIKTINGQSVLGEGNIEISGAGGGVVYVTLDVSKLTTNNSFYITDSELSSIKMSRNGNTVIVKDTNNTTADSEWGQVVSCYRQYAGSSVYTYRVSILHKDNTPLSGADNAKLYNVDIMDSPQSSGYYCIVTSINNLY